MGALIYRHIVPRHEIPEGWQPTLIRRSDNKQAISGVTTPSGWDVYFDDYYIDPQDRVRVTMNVHGGIGTINVVMI